MKTVILIAIISLTLSGCITSNTSKVPVADPHRYGELTPGSSTKYDATAALGSPNSITHFPNGSALLQWLDVYAATPIDVAILFGPDGKMIRIQQVTIP
jgi:ABC-type Fe3+-siderophore transport system permease subunit